MTFLRWIAVLALVALPARAEPQPQDETVYLEEVKKEFLDRAKKCEESRDWKGLFDHYQFALKRYGQSVVQISPDRWTSVREYFIGRFARLPKEAFAFYRFENDGKARAAFDRARESGSRRDLERAVEEYFFATGSDELMDALACQAFDEGRVEEARSGWFRLLSLYPDSQIPRAVTAARIANVCRVSENASALAELRKYLARHKVEGRIMHGGQPVEIGAYVDGIALPDRPPASRPSKMPFVPEPEDRHRRPTLGVRNDIRRWVYDFSEDRGEAAAEAPPDPQKQVVVRGMLRGRVVFRGDVSAPPPYSEFPLLPAAARVRGKEYVIFTDGSRVVAVDPARVKAKSTSSGVYWKYPSEKSVARPLATPNAQFGRPYIGVTIDGEYAFAAMYSSPEVRPREQNQGNLDGFEGVTAVKCLHIPTGKLVWDTDLSPLQEEFKTVCKDFYERNFSFSAPPLVRGDRLYLGVCTSPMGEQESRVLCLDRKTGRPLWTTFLSSVAGAQPGFMNGGIAFQPAALPMLVQQGGTLFVQTNLGVVGALNPASGALQWLTRYKRSGRRIQPNNGTMDAGFQRPANPPVFWNGTLFILAQDRAELMAFDASSGEEIKLPSAAEMHGDLDWRSMLHLLGPVNDDLVITGSSWTFELHLRDEKGPCFHANKLIASACKGTGCGTIGGDFVYLPVVSDPPGLGGLGLYDIRTWKIVEQTPWKESNEGGNLLIAGDYLVVATNRICLYTDVETLRNQYARRLNQSPPHAESLLEFGDTMRENQRLEEAGEAYLSFIRAVEGDPGHVEKVREVRRSLHAIFLKRGDEASKRAEEAGRPADGARQPPDPAKQLQEAQKALECYAMAKKFAWDRDSEAEAVKRLAGTYEGLGLWKEAVGQYHELIQKGRQLFHRKGEDVTKLWDHAARRIDDIVSKVPGAYQEVEQQAAEALKTVKDESVDGLRDVMDRFPNSKAARDAFGKMRDTLLKQGRLDKLRALYGDFQDRFKLKLNFDAYRELLELLEKLGDLDRLKFELVHFGERFGEESIGTDGSDEPVKDFVERRLAELGRRPRATPLLKGPLRFVGELEAIKPTSDPQGVALGHLPLCPLGVEPAAFGSDHELFKRGSSVELWDLKAKRRLWARAHPGAWLGALYGDSPQGVSVMFVKQGSPAEKAGLRKDDVLLSVDGFPLLPSTMSELFSGLAPGRSVEIVYRRAGAGADAQARVQLAPVPAESRPAIVGASFTREGALAVAWEDLLASIDLSTGDVQWTFRVSRDRFHFHAFHATEGRLYLYEALRGDRSADPMRMFTPGAPLVFKPEEAHHLLFCLSDFTGEVLWARKFSFEPLNPLQEYKLEFLGMYFSDYVTFLQMTSRSGMYEWSLWMIPAQAGARSESGPLREQQRRPILGQKMAHAVDEEGGIFYYVADLPERRERILYSLNLNPARQNFKPIEIQLQQAKYLQANSSYSVCSLAADRDFIALVVSPWQAGVEHRIWVWKTSDLKDRALSLLEGRTLPANHPAGLGIGPDGMLYVYNVPREKTAGLSGRAYLTAFRLKAAAGEDPVAWDSKAPAMNDTSSATMLHDAGGFEVLAAARASAPGESGEGPAVIVYDRNAEGSVRLDRSDLVQPTDPSGEWRPSAIAWRGRLYLTTQKALEIFGN